MTGHVLLARLDSMGDVLLCGPAVRAVAAGAARVTMLCGPAGAAAAEMLPGVDAVLVHEAPWVVAEPRPLDRAATLRLVDSLAALRLDEAIVFTSFHQSPLPLALLLRLAAVPRLSAISVDYPGSLLDVRHHVSEDLHEVQRALSLACAAGYRPASSDAPRLQVVRRSRLPDDLRTHRPYVVVHPGAAAPARAWPAERHAALVQQLADRGRNVVVTGSAAEGGLVEQVAGRPRPEVVAWAGRGELADLAEVVAEASVVVAANTGPAHLAAALGTPVVSLFAPTVPAHRWRPWGVPYVLLGDQAAACADSRAVSCPTPGHPCLGAVTAETAWLAVQHLAGASQPASGIAL